MSDFAQRIIAWQRQHGRHDLPWQRTHDAYRIWLSEIMLQQTQVAAVIAYFERFVARFPDLAALAAADENDVLQLWSGLGYYSRARNLHRAALEVMKQHAGHFPREAQQLALLPGVGRSTAAAIAVFAFGKRAAILDGNVKRVLARCFGIDGLPTEKPVENKLWQLAESLLPDADLPAYTQGLMDLGASLCARSKPACARCPLDTMCVAKRDARQHELPAKRPPRNVPHRHTTMLIIRHAGEVLLEKRPPTGVWGSLWSFPEISADEDAGEVCRRRFQIETAAEQSWPQLRHGFTHFDLTITPQPLLVTAKAPAVAAPGVVWLSVEEAKGAAIPTPVRVLLERLG